MGVHLRAAVARTFRGLKSITQRDDRYNSRILHGWMLRLFQYTVPGHGYLRGLCAIREAVIVLKETPQLDIWNGNTRLHSVLAAVYHQRKSRAPKKKNMENMMETSDRLFLRTSANPKVLAIPLQKTE